MVRLETHDPRPVKRMKIKVPALLATLNEGVIANPQKRRLSSG